MKPLLHHQDTGADFLINHPVAGIFDDPGSGKSRTVIEALDRGQMMRGIVVGPAISRETWRAEFQRWAAISRKIIVAKDDDDFVLWKRGRRDVLICSYDYAVRRRKLFERLEDIVEFLVIDESHYLKNPAAERTQALLGSQCDGRHSVSANAAYVWFLTGTVMANDPTDAWTFLRRSGATTLTSAQFKTRWFDSSPTTHGARYSVKPGAEERIKEMLASVSLRRPKSEWWKDAPPVLLLEQRMHGQDAKVRELIAQHPDLDEIVRKAALEGTLEDLAQEIEYIARLRRLIGEAKAPPFAADLVERMQGGLEKAVVMTWHTAAGQIVADALNAKGIPTEIIRGDVPMRQRQKIIEEFQRPDSKLRCVVGNIRAAGTNITLTAAADIFMLEQSWSPADNLQALMRVHRIGQTRSVRATFVSLADTIDDVVVATLAEKVANIAEIDAHAFKLSA